MKRLLTFIVLIVLGFSLCACGNTAVASTDMVVAKKCPLQKVEEGKPGTIGEPSSIFSKSLYCCLVCPGKDNKTTDYVHLSSDGSSLDIWINDSGRYSSYQKLRSIQYIIDGDTYQIVFDQHNTQSKYIIYLEPRISDKSTEESARIANALFE